LELSIGYVCNNWTADSTKLDQMFKLCQVRRNESDQQKLNVYPSYYDYYQTRLIEIFLIELIPFVLIPCACLVGFFSKLENNSNHKREQKERFKRGFLQIHER
jgi:hypothetical protein